MKKILAFLMAVTMCFCAFTACGNKDGSSSEKSDKKSSSEAEDKEEKEDTDSKDSKNDDEKNSENETESEKETESETDAPEVIVIEDETDKPANDNNGSENEVYLAAFQKLIDAVKTKDSLNILKATLPDMTVDAIVNTESIDALTASMGSFSGFGFDNITATEIVAVDECDADVIEKLEKLYSVYSNMFIIMDENDISYNDVMSGNIDDDKAMLIMDAANQLSQIDDFESLDVDISVKFEDAKMVTFSYNNMEEKSVVYKVAGEDWKLDSLGAAAIGY